MKISRNNNRYIEFPDLLLALSTSTVSVLFSPDSITNTLQFMF